MRWKHPLAAKEIIIDWKDYGLPHMGPEFWTELLKAIQRQPRTLMFCVGSHGRTGTAASILTGLSKGITGKKAIRWVRLHHCEKSVETAEQRYYVNRVIELAGQKGANGKKKHV